MYDVTGNLAWTASGCISFFTAKSRSSCLGTNVWTNCCARNLSEFVMHTYIWAEESDMISYFSKGPSMMTQSRWRPFPISCRRIQYRLMSFWSLISRNTEISMNFSSGTRLFTSSKGRFKYFAVGHLGSSSQMHVPLRTRATRKAYVALQTVG